MASELVPLRPLGRTPRNSKELVDQVGAAANHAALETYDPEKDPDWFHKFRQELYRDLRRRQVLIDVTLGRLV